MSIKLHYLKSHADKFPQNRASVGKEQGERFHQDIKTIGERYKGRYSHVMADYCWSLKRDRMSQRLPTKESLQRENSLVRNLYLNCK